MATGVLLAARSYVALEIPSGHFFRVTAVDGRQCADLVFFNLEDLSERLSPTNTQLFNGTYLITEGHSLYSNYGRGLAHIVIDTVRESGIVGGSCSAPANYARFGIPDTPNCRSNLLAAGEPYGLEEPDISHIYAPFWTAYKLPDGSYLIDQPKSEPGDHIEFEALLPLLVVFSVCPQERTASNAFNPTRLHAWVGAANEPRPNLEGILQEAGDAHH